MNHRHLLTVLFVLLLTACASRPGEQADIDAVMRASGLENQINLLQTPLQTDKLDGPLALIPEQWISMVNSSIATHVKPEVIRQQLRQELEKNLSAAELNAVQRFYESSTGLHVVAIESGQTQAPASAAALPADQRQALDTLAAATGYGRAVSQLAQSGLDDAVDVAVKNGCFGLDQYPFASVLVGVVKKAQLAALRESVNSVIRQRYAELSAAERKDYLEFAQSAAGKNFLAARARVFQDTAQTAGSALNEVLGEEVKKICKAAP